ncbi:MAG TPA: 3-dehydroquinate synthase family protein [Candidatus Baltobacteraceae bacterium]|nr:3-dehydroquinate synthase family protein [Candidatus Baltobacteraceae bacterium]
MAAQEENRDLASDFIVNTDLRYPICVGEDVRAPLGSFIEHRGQRFMILSDAHRDVVRVALDIDKLPGSLGMLAFALGESRKRLSTVEMVHDALLELGVARDTLIIGVGGGVASDLFGFCAATYMRGVPYVHVATTLVAMVDAAVGGKTGVDVRAGKNIVGSFTDPVAVFAHTGALQTLEYRHLREGLAEVVKAAIIEGDAFFESIEALAPHAFWRWPWLEVVAEAIKVKTMIVADDRQEAGIRELLNLGHTFGHALETASGYRVSHGVGVALGLRAAGLLAMRTGRFSEEEHLRILATMALLGMPLSTSVGVEATLAAMASDKKKRGGKLRFVLPRAIGDVEYGIEVPERTVRSVLAQLRRSPESFG